MLRASQICQRAGHFQNTIMSAGGKIHHLNVMLQISGTLRHPERSAGVTDSFYSSRDTNIHWLIEFVGASLVKLIKFRTVENPVRLNRPEALPNRCLDSLARSEEPSGRPAHPGKSKPKALKISAALREVIAVIVIDTTATTKLPLQLLTYGASRHTYSTITTSYSLMRGFPTSPENSAKILYIFPESSLTEAG